MSKILRILTFILKTSIRKVDSFVSWLSCSASINMTSHRSMGSSETRGSTLRRQRHCDPHVPVSTAQGSIFSWPTRNSQILPQTLDVWPLLLLPSPSHPRPPLSASHLSILKPNPIYFTPNFCLYVLSKWMVHKTGYVICRAWYKMKV